MAGLINRGCKRTLNPDGLNLARGQQLDEVMMGALFFRREDEVPLVREAVLTPCELAPEDIERIERLTALLGPEPDLDET